ncbi:hypothetical protein NECAME_00014 [Necator americanus]|uniref:Uncharacterized protein n=1 Tax=Necator americanus TaxID=51031 RepID=W2TYK5_NECAM|nr:hypothetical protein NECAME_00014 [Necator americanus]ETN87155.1 hypothetical protein NECAME_00014 [Necator americanus]
MHCRVEILTSNDFYAKHYLDRLNGTNETPMMSGNNNGFCVEFQCTLNPLLTTRMFATTLLCQRTS